MPRTSCQANPSFVHSGSVQRGACRYRGWQRAGVPVALGELLALSILVLPAAAAAQVTLVQPFANTATGGLVDNIIRIINALLVLAAIAAFAYIIISGVRYFAAQGDERALEQAKYALIYGIVGIVVIILAAVIVNFFVVNVV
jgi:hypothetical protein